MTVVEFLRERLDEDEAVARHEVDLMERLLTPREEWTLTYQWARFTVHVSGGSGAHYAPGAPSPTRVLADIDAKRRILDLHDRNHECSSYDHRGEIDDCSWVYGWACSTLQLLVEPYADHPDFDPAWRVTT